MTDTREDILDRLLDICSGLAGVRLATRNDEAIGEQMRPAIILFDGNELAAEDDPDNRPNSAPRRVTMTPDILLLLGDTQADVGTAVNEWRAKIVKAIQLDAQLNTLTLDRGGIRYLGVSSNLEPGRDTEFWLLISFSFTYVLKFQAL